MTIDLWTLGLQAINVLVLVWLLGRFFWRPVSQMIEDRRAGIARTLADADARLARSAAAEKDIAATRAGFDAERQSILAEARKAAEAERTVVLAKAADEARQVAAAAEAGIAQERAEIGAGWNKRAAALAVDIAGRLVGEMGADAVRQAFFDRLLASIAAMPDDQRRALVDGSGRLEAVTAADVPPDDQRRLREQLCAALRSTPQIAFRTDPRLLAGIELVGPHLIVRNSWQADLSAILAELDHA